jgi:hypothetical protein
MRRAAAFGLTLLTTLSAWPAGATEKFALSMYHFNIQYVQGGLRGAPTGTDDTAGGPFDLNDDQVQDLIITQSFEPVLDLYARHPAWGCDLELQGYMVDVIKARHPGVLAKLKALVDNGQVSLDSFHFSDQLWVAYPRSDMEKSYALTLKSFDAAGLKHGNAVWTQEGQFAMGMERFLRERGVQTSVLPHGLFSWHYPSLPVAALYRMGATDDVLTVVTGGMEDDKVQVSWDFVDDGEKAMTGGGDPYLGTSFKYDPVSSQKREDQYLMEEQSGWKHATVAGYVKRAIELGEVPQPLPQVIDGNWRPNDGHDMFTWMGGAGSFDALFLPGTSADNSVHTKNSRARKAIVAAERSLAALNRHDRDADLEQAWKDVLLGEGSDGSGWSPWIGERKYSEAHALKAKAEADAILADVAIAPRLLPVRTAVKLMDDPGPLQLVADPTAHRPPHSVWKKRDGQNVWELTVTFDAIADDPNDKDRFTMAVTFPRATDHVVWSGALEDEALRDIALADIKGSNSGLVGVPCANGLIGLADDTFLIQDTDVVHLAAVLSTTVPTVQIKDNTAPLDAVTWHFVVVKGTQAEALAEAKALNVEPTQVLGPEVAKKGCGCTGGSADVLALLGGLIVLRSRRSGRSSGRA